MGAPISKIAAEVETLYNDYRDLLDLSGEMLATLRLEPNFPHTIQELNDMGLVEKWLKRWKFHTETRDPDA